MPENSAVTWLSFQFLSNYQTLNNHILSVFEFIIYGSSITLVITSNLDPFRVMPGMIIAQQHSANSY